MKQFKVKLDKPRTLKLTNSSLRDMELLLGDGKPKTVFDIVDLRSDMDTADLGLGVLSKLTSIDLLHKIVYFGLQHTEEAPSLEECLDMIPMNRALEIATICLNMLFDAYGLGDMVDPDELKQNGQVVGIGTKEKKQR